MKLHIKIISVFVCIVACISFFANTAQALELSNSYIRLSRSKAAQAPGNILIVATTGENVTEDEVQITAGSAWSISPTAGNFTVSTSGLPSGVTAWPGIGTATQVSSNAITFPSTDLTSGVTYGFFITGGISTNPSAGENENYLWNIATVVASSVSSDSDSMVPIIANDQIVISAEVPALSYYFNADILRLTAGSSYPQNTTLNYQITYGSTLSQSTPLTLQAEWTEGTIQGSGSPSVAVATYVTNSASDAYGSTAPVIDTLNRTITWTIPSIPASTTNQTVTFSLETTTNYTGSLPVSFDVLARITNPATTSDTTSSQTYVYSPTPTPTPIPVSGSGKKSCDQSCATDTECDTNYCYLVTGTCRDQKNPSSPLCKTVQTPPSSADTTAASPSPTPSFEILDFDGITIDEISNIDATIKIFTNKNSTLQLSYGKNQNQLTSQESSSQFKTLHSFHLSSLDPNTVYYFQLVATDEEGHTLTSDIFSFTTASQELTAKIDWSKTLIISQGIRLNSLTNPRESQAVIPTSFPFEISLFFEDASSLQKVTALYNKEKVPLFEDRPGNFVGKLLSSSTREIESQNIHIEVQDIFGNLKKYPFFELEVVSPFMVLESEKIQPVEKARVHFYKFDLNKKIYELISPKTLLENNPLYTDNRGQILMPLTYGKYRVEIDALGYKKMSFDFEVSKENLPFLSTEERIFPTLFLEKDAFSIGSFASYHATTALDLAQSVGEQLTQQSLSHKILELLQVISLIFFALLVPFSLSARTHIPLRKLPHFLFSHFLLMFGNSPTTQWTLQGKLIDESTEQPISGAVISFFDEAENQNIGEAVTNRMGEFRVLFSKDTILYTVVKKGYIAQEGFFSKEANATEPQVIEIFKSKSLPQKIGHKLLYMIENIAGVLFEFAMIASIVLQVLFLKNLGVMRVLPFLLVSLLTLFIWVFFLSSGHFTKPSQTH